MKKNPVFYIVYNRTNFDAAVAELAYAYDLPAGRQAQNRMDKKYFVYVLKSLAYNYFYVGISDDFKRRVKQHNKKYNRTTKPYAPFKLILTEEYKDRIEARRGEKFLKSGCGKEYIKSLKI